jgi:preprotein translocase subunit SecG
MMLTVVVVIHIVVCISICIIVLMQRGKGAEVGAVFGGSSQTVFGASGAGGALVRVTAMLAAIFFLTSIFLAYASTKRATGSIFEGSVRVPTRSAPAGKTSVPAAPPLTGAPPAATHPSAPSQAPSQNK